MKSVPTNRHKTRQDLRNIRDRRLMLQRKKQEQAEKLEHNTWIPKQNL